MIRELDFLEYADLLDYLQDEDELADEIRCCNQSHDSFEHIHKIETI